MIDDKFREEIEVDLENMLSEYIFRYGATKDKNYLIKANNMLEGVKNTFSKYQIYKDILGDNYGKSEKR